LDAFDFSFQPTLSERRLRVLADLSFVRTCTNVVFLGPPGTGKTHLSLALAERALTVGHSVLFTTLAELAQALESAFHPGLLRQRLRRYIAPNVLVIDEVGYTKLSQEQAHHFFELVTARYEHGSIILTSNTSFAHWGNLLGDEVLASALLDRLLHHAEVITTKAISRIVNQSRCQPKSQRCRMQHQNDSLSYPLTRSMGKASPSVPVGSERPT
jgi:DNA replication protein DnaC